MTVPIWELTSVGCKQFRAALPAEASVDQPPRRMLPWAIAFPSFRAVDFLCNERGRYIEAIDRQPPLCKSSPPGSAVFRNFTVTEMEPLPRPVDGDRDRGPQLLAMWWTELSICIVMVAMRFYSRYKLKNFGLDDWLMLTALVRKTYTQC